MSKKSIFVTLGVLVAVVITVVAINNSDKPVGADSVADGSADNKAEQATPINVDNAPVVSDVQVNPVVTQEGDQAVKEFSMTSFTEVKDGKYFPQYSLKELVVNKGDKVRIKITVTGGMHDFKIDEYNVYADTQLNKESVVEFVADKAGDFIYYCTKPNHRQNGHWGTLRVLEAK